MAGARFEIDDPVDERHHRQVVLDDDDRLAGVDQPIQEPETPVRTVSRRLGMATLMFSRLFCRARYSPVPTTQKNQPSVAPQIITPPQCFSALCGWK